MKDAVKYLESELNRLKARAREITRKAEDEDREMTPDELSSVESILSEAEGIKARQGELKRNADLQDRIDGITGEGAGTEVTEGADGAKTLGEAFIKSDAYRALKERGLTGRFSTGPIEVKSVGDGILQLGDHAEFQPGSASHISPQVVPGIYGPVEQRLTLAELFGQGTATQNTIVFLEETVTDNDAAVTAEGAEKPDSYLEFEKTSVALEKIATFLPVSDEMLEDEPQIASYINGRLATFVRQAEEARLLAVLLATSGIGSADETDVDGSNMFDAIAAGIMSVQVDGGLEPDAVVIHPTDFWTMAVSKDGVNGGYFSGGPYAGPARNPWGLRSVVTTRVSAGSPIVGAFAQGATVWRKGGLTVEASNSHSDYFRKNLTAIRAEERVALAVYRPQAFCVVGLSS